MFLAALPGCVRQPRPGRRRARPEDEVLLDFEDFTSRLLDWVEWWNTSHHPKPLGGRSPLEVWQADPTPVREVNPEELWTSKRRPGPAYGQVTGQTPRGEQVPAPVGWTKTFTAPRLCAAIVDRLTFNGTIIGTGTDSYRLASTRARAEHANAS